MTQACHTKVLLWGLCQVFIRIFKQTFKDYFRVRSPEVAYFWRVVLVWSLSMERIILESNLLTLKRTVMADLRRPQLGNKRRLNGQREIYTVAVNFTNDLRLTI